MLNSQFFSGWIIRKSFPKATKSSPKRQFKASFITPVIALTLLFFLNVTGCGKDSITSEDNSSATMVSVSPGTFRAEITGTTESKLEGIASFNSSEDQLTLSLTVLGPDGITLWRNGGRPAAGDYEVTGFTAVLFFGEPGFGGSLFLMQHGGFYATQSGTFTITNSSVTNLSGEFEFAAVDDEDENASDVQEITVIGSFRARCDESCL